MVGEERPVRSRNALSGLRLDHSDLSDLYRRDIPETERPRLDDRRRPRTGRNGNHGPVLRLFVPGEDRELLFPT